MENSGTIKIWRTHGTTENFIPEGWSMDWKSHWENWLLKISHWHMPIRNTQKSKPNHLLDLMW